MSHERGPSDGAPPSIGTDVPGRAPRAQGLEPPRSAQQLVDELVGLYRDQVRRALSFELDDTATALAFVDHHLSTASREARAPILSLLAASAGAYYGELVRRLLGGMWIGDGKDPRRLRMLMMHQFIYFSPVDQAFEAIAGESLESDDPRLGGIERFDPAFRLRPIADPDDPEEDDDAVWLSARLAELPAVPEPQFVSLTSRFETLELMHEMLATKHASEGRSPETLRVEDYLDALTSDPARSAE